VIADPDDDHVLACAIAVNADLIVSGDKHLLDLKATRASTSSMRVRRYGESLRSSERPTSGSREMPRITPGRI
jgi:predicted nucleic acid-binding protein